MSKKQKLDVEGHCMRFFKGATEYIGWYKCRCVPIKGHRAMVIAIYSKFDADSKKGMEAKLWITKEAKRLYPFVIHFKIECFNTQAQVCLVKKACELIIGFVKELDCIQEKLVLLRI
jgi:hypothetical protein